MPVARFQMPDGRIARFEVPEGTTPEAAQAMVGEQFPNLTRVTDYTTLAQLEGKLKPVTDKSIIHELENGSPVAKANPNAGGVHSKIATARENGYTDSEILSHLRTTDLAPKIEQATTAGYGDGEILEFLGQAPKRSTGEQVARQGGLTLRAGIEGLTAIPGMIADAGVALYNKGAGGIEKLTGIPQTRYGSPRAAQSELLTRGGLPAPENANERFSQDVAGGLAGTGGMMKVGELMAKSAGPVVSRVGDMLSKQRGLQTVSTATGSGAASVARENDVGIVGQILAGVAGGMAPAAASFAAPATVRGMFRGGDAGRQRVAENIRDFEQSGYGTPTVGQATESRIARAVESGLSKTPGGAGPMSRRAEAGASGVGSRVANLADDLSPNATSTKAGAAIEKGVDKFVDRFKAEQGFLYDKLDTHIPKQKPVDMTNTLNRLSELNAEIPGAPALSKFFQNDTIRAIQGAMKSDTGDFTQRLPYEAIKKLRTLVGSELENTGLTSDVPRSKWKALYGALSDDLAEAAREAGPDAQKAYQRANSFTSAGHDRIGTYLDRVAGKDTVEKIFQAAVNPSEIREGASTLNAVVRSIDPQGRKVVQAAFLKRLGTAAAGAQDEAGEVFSTERFLTNWNKISPEAKMTLFAGQKGTLREDLDKVAKVAANLREGSKVFANPSGTQGALSGQFAGGGILVALVTGHLGLAALIGGGMVAANQSAKLMSAPWFVKWLAQSTAAPTGAIPAQLQTLAEISKNQPPEDREAAADFIRKAKTVLERQGR